MHKHRHHESREVRLPKHPSRGSTHPSPKANARRPVEAAYASGLPTCDFPAIPLNSQAHQRPRHDHVLRPPDFGSRATAPLRLHHVHNRVNMPKRRVHFDLAPQPPTQRQHDRKPSRQNLHCPSTPAHPLRRPGHPNTQQKDTTARIHRSSPRHNIRHETSPHNPHPRPQPASLPPRLLQSTDLTIHILTYALTRTPHHTDVSRMLLTYLPPSALLIHTIPAYTFIPPPQHLCALYSGISPIIQEHVMRDPLARNAVKYAVEELIEFEKRERRKGGAARKEVALGVCCEFGTHRSVSVAERIATEIMRTGMRVRVRVVHVHRVRGKRDPG